LASVAFAVTFVAASSGARAPVPVADHPVALAAASAADTDLPADCQPKADAPPYQLGTLIQVGHPAGLDPSVPDGTLTAGPVGVTGLAASLCGVVTVSPGTGGCAAQGTITIPADGQLFNPLQAVLSVNPAAPDTVPFRVVPLTITASLGCGSSADGVVVDTTADLAGSTGLFGIACQVGPALATLSGTFTSPTGSFSDLRGTLSGTIAIPPAEVTHTCPSEIAANLDDLAGLPRTGEVSLPTEVSIYQPVAP
jgi:hypothetical protein